MKGCKSMRGCRTVRACRAETSPNEHFLKIYYRVGKKFIAYEIIVIGDYVIHMWRIFSSKKGSKRNGNWDDHVLCYCFEINKAHC
jgi:hypothetical protein